jgi:hypothetical protein
MEPRRDQTDIRPMIIGGLLGGGGGFALWMGTDIFVFLPVFLAIGLVVGMSLGLPRSQG